MNNSIHDILHGIIVNLCTWTVTRPTIQIPFFNVFDNIETWTWKQKLITIDQFIHQKLTLSVNKTNVQTKWPKNQNNSYRLLTWTKPFLSSMLLVHLFDQVKSIICIFSHIDTKIYLEYSMEHSQKCRKISVHSVDIKNQEMRNESTGAWHTDALMLNCGVNVCCGSLICGFYFPHFQHITNTNAEDTVIATASTTRFTGCVLLTSSPPVSPVCCRVVRCMKDCWIGVTSVFFTIRKIETIDKYQNNNR